MSIGGNIRKLRELRNYTQSYMADNLNLSISGYGKIERDEIDITLSRIKEIAKILETDYSRILNFDDKQVFNFNKNKVASGVVHNQQNNSFEELKPLIELLVKDNILFKEFLKNVMRKE